MSDNRQTPPTGSEESRAAIAALDTLAIADKRGFIEARLGFAVNLFFPDGGKPAVRLALCSILREYHGIFGEQLTHFQKVDADRLTPIKGPGYLDYYEEQARVFPTDETFDAVVYGYPNGLEVDEPSAISMAFTATGPNPLMPLGVSCLSVYFPARIILDRGYDYLIERTMAWAQQAHAIHGTAGFSVLFDHGTGGLGGASQTALPSLKRFPGLDYSDLGQFTVESRKGDGCKIMSINWLTVLTDELAGLMGGKERLAEVLGPSCPIHDYNGGIVIQAGPEPQLGDLNRGLVLDDYRRVSQALASIRFEDYPRGLFILGEPFDPLDETLKWVRRFD